MRERPSSIIDSSVSLPSVKALEMSRARSTSVSLIWRARASSAALSFCAPVSSASARVWNSLMSAWPRSASVRSMPFRLASKSAFNVRAAPPSRETMPAVRSSRSSLSERVRPSVVSVSLAMRVSSRLAKASPEVDRRSVMESSRFSTESKIDIELSLMRSMSVSPDWLIVIDRLVEADRMFSRIRSPAELISSFNDSWAPAIDARTRSAWPITASRSLPRPSTRERMRASLSL